MSPRKKSAKGRENEKTLTEAELELMNAIWELGPCTVKDVQTALPKERDLAYTTVATIMKILEQKGFLESEKADRAHTYRPLVSRGEYETTSLKDVQNRVFRGDRSSMVMRLLDEEGLTPRQLAEIRKLLDERMSK